MTSGILARSLRRLVIAGAAAAIGVLAIAGGVGPAKAQHGASCSVPACGPN